MKTRLYSQNYFLKGVLNLSHGLTVNLPYGLAVSPLQLKNVETYKFLFRSSAIKQSTQVSTTSDGYSILMRLCQAKILSSTALGSEY